MNAPYALLSLGIQLDTFAIDRPTVRELVQLYFTNASTI